MQKPSSGQLFDSALAVLVVSVIIYVIYAAYFGVKLSLANNQAQDYRVSQGCISNSVANNPLMSDCTWSTYTIRSKDVIKKWGQPEYHIALSNSSGIIADETVDRGLFRRNAVGDSLQVECWPDNVPIAVSDSTETYRTELHPYRVVKSAGLVLQNGTVVFIILVLGLCLVLVRSTRKLVEERPEDAVDIMMLIARDEEERQLKKKAEESGEDEIVDGYFNW